MHRVGVYKSDNSYNYLLKILDVIHVYSEFYPITFEKQVQNKVVQFQVFIQYSSIHPTMVKSGPVWLSPLFYIAGLYLRMSITKWDGISECVISIYDLVLQMLYFMNHFLWCSLVLNTSWNYRFKTYHMHIWKLN